MSYQKRKPRHLGRRNDTGGAGPAVAATDVPTRRGAPGAEPTMGIGGISEIEQEPHNSCQVCTPTPNHPRTHPHHGYAPATG